MDFMYDLLLIWIAIFAFILTIYHLNDPDLRAYNVTLMRPAGFLSQFFITLLYMTFLLPFIIFSLLLSSNYKNRYSQIWLIYIIGLIIILLFLD